MLFSLPRILDDLDPPTVKVFAGTIHHCRIGGGSRREDLHLFGSQMQIPENEFTQVPHVSIGATRVGSYEIIG